MGESQRVFVEVLEAGPEHFDGMVDCHVAAFPAEFLTMMGRRFLKAFYRFYAEQPEGICLAAVEDRSKRVVGLCIGGEPRLRSRFSHAYVPRYAFRIFYRALRSRFFRRRLLAVHFAGLLRSIRRKAHLGGGADEHVPPADPPGTWSSLLSICTHPDTRGRGVGKMLMEAFRADSAKRGYKSMRLSVHNDNEGAQALYRKCGWQEIGRTPEETYFQRAVDPGR